MTQPRPTVGPAAGSGAAHLHAAATAADPGESPAGGLRRLVCRVQGLLAWWSRTRPARANARFGAAGGGVLTGGIAYAALFSVFAALTVGFTVFLAVLGGNHALRDQVVAAIDGALPGLVSSGGSTGLIDVDSLRLSGGFTAAGVIAAVTLLLSAVSAVAALQTGVRAMFDLHTGENAVAGTLRRLVGFVAMALAVLVSAALTLALTAVADAVLSAAGWSAASAWVLRVLGVLVAFVLDAGTFVLVVVVLARARPARRDLLGGAAIAGVGIGAVRLLGAGAVSGSAGRNPVLASFAVVVVLLVWVNLIARIVLLAAAWTADPPAP